MSGVAQWTVSGVSLDVNPHPPKGAIGGAHRPSDSRRQPCETWTGRRAEPHRLLTLRDHEVTGSSGRRQVTFGGNLLPTADNLHTKEPTKQR